MKVDLGWQPAELPAELHGFRVEIFVGPYPAGTLSHRRAVYAKLTPTTDELRKKLKWIGRGAILGQAPIDKATADQIAEDPQQILETEREALALAALRPAAALARTVAEA